MLQRIVRAPVFGALHHRNFRLYWLGLIVAVVGWQVQFVAQSWLAYQITDSPFYLGLVGGASAVPSIVFAFFGGVVADRVNRRRLLMLTQVVSAFLLLSLATLVVTGLVTIWHVLVVSFLSGTVVAFERPARTSMVPLLIDDKKELMNAIALDSSVWQISRIVGPAIAGFLTAVLGVAVCFYLTAAGYLAMLGALYYVRTVEQAVGAGSQSIWSNVKEGVGYVWRNQVFLVLVGLTFVNSIFGTSYLYIMPVFARDILQVGAQGYGFLITASGIGALVGALIVGSLGNFRRRGWLVIVASLAYGVLVLVFSRSRLFPLSFSVVALAGMCYSLYMITIQTVLQGLVPDSLRGRVMGIYGLTWSLWPLGGMVLGTLATFWGAPLSVTVAASVLAGFTVFMAATTPLLRRIR
ncbi:MAG: hypothetical protein HW414_852 [Dehalococcoidia bacterium]|nr:hypothetical protein [Dehalococcoidia bacterium]